MDLEQFRRAYMHMEGVTNTPGNFVKRSSRLVESVVNIPGAIKRDVDESKMNAKIKKDILNDIRENGGKNFDADIFRPGKKWGSKTKPYRSCYGAAWPFCSRHGKERE